ncbi:unnamed protein product [Penicillium crustosum]
MRKYHALGAAAGAAAAAVLSGLFIMRRNRRRPSPSLVHERGQVVVITGGSRGLGHELAQLYIAADARVAILDIKDEDEDGACASSTRYYKCDVSNSEDVEMTLNRVESELGPPKTLINCAATKINQLPFSDLSNDKFMQTIAINLLGSVNTTRAILNRAVSNQRSVTIVTVSSVVAHLYPAGLSDYVVSKAGLSALHHCLEAEARLEAVDDQVRFVLVEVGQMDTPLFSWINPPNPSLAPVLCPRYVAEQIVRRLGQDKGSSILRLPMYASWVCGYDMLPPQCQRWARHLMGVDMAHSPKGVKDI